MSAGQSDVKNWGEAWRKGAAQAAVKEEKAVAPASPAETPATEGKDAPADAAKSDAASEKAEPVEAPSEKADVEASDDAADGDDKPEAAAEKPKDDKKEPVGDATGKQLAELAKKLGFVVDGKHVLPEDRAKFRAEKREWHEKARAAQADFDNKIALAQQHLAPLFYARKKFEAGDLDGALKDAFGEDYNEISKKIVAMQANPAYKAQKELESRLEAAERRERQREQEAAEAYARAQQERAQTEHMLRLGSALQDEGFSKLAANKRFLGAVFAKQQEYWDGETTLSPKEAAELVIEDIRADDALQEIFGARDTKTHESSDDSPSAARGSSNPAKSGGEKKRPPKTLQQRKAAEASPPGRALTEAEWMKRHVAILKQSEPGPE